MPAPLECPQPENWQALLDDALPPEQWACYERHLESCPACQDRLDRAGEGGDPLRLLGRKLGDPTLVPEDPALVRVLERLREGKGAASPVDAADLYFLRPSDLPGILGTLGDYDVLEVIGQGGMGLVLKAYESALNRFVAIKVLAAALAGSATARRRFTREARAAASVAHDHVVAVHGVSEVEGLPYLVMQYVAGESLQDRLDRTGPLDVEEAVRIGMQTAQGLAAAHAQGLIHRDIKPANLLLEDGVARVKITDFGLARTADDAGLTREGVVAGTPEYMSPEQARGEAVDHRADLFSLGGVLYACCTGRPPFRGSTALAVLRRVNDEQPPPLGSLNPGVPAWLEGLVARLLAKDPAERFQTAAEVAALLEGYLAHLRQPATFPAPELPAGRPEDRSRPFGPGAATASARWLRRGLGVAALVLAVALAAGIALGLPGAGDKAPDWQTSVQTFKGGTECPSGFRSFGPGAEQYVRFQPNGMRITLPPGSHGDGGATGVRSPLGAGGDFEITVSYDVLAEAPPADPGLHARLTLEVPLDGSGTSAISISRRMGKDGGADYQPWMRLWNEATQRDEQWSEAVPTAARSGRLRIARAGSTCSYYAADGQTGDFVLLERHRCGGQDLKEIVLAAATEDPQASLDVLVHDLQVRARSLSDLPADAGLRPVGAKNRGWLMAAAIIGLLTALAAVAGWLLARRARRARLASATGSRAGPAAAARPIAFVCSRCGHGLKVKAELAGKRGKCPKCGELVLVPQDRTDAPAAPPAPGVKGIRSWKLVLAGLALGLPLLVVLLLVVGWRLRHHEEAQPTSLIGVSLGGEPVPGVAESGFFYQEYDKGEPFRWTDGNGQLVVPIDRARPPQAVDVHLHAYRRPGENSASLQVLANGRELFNDRIHLGSWEKTFDLRGVPLGDRLTLELKSDTFNPAGTPNIIDRKTPSDDSRTLGVQVRSVKLLPRAVEIRDLTEPDRTVAIREDHPAGLRAGALTPDGKTLVTGGWDGSVTVWDVAAGRKRLHLAGLTLDPRGPAADPGLPGQPGRRRLIAQAMASQAVAPSGTGAPVWPHVLVALKIARGDAFPVPTRIAGPGLVALAVSPDGATFATATADRVVRVWDAATGQRRAELRGHAGPVTLLAYAPDGSTLASVGVDRSGHGELKFWDVAAGKERRPTVPIPFQPRALAYAPDSHFVAVAGASWTTEVIATSSGGLRTSFDYPSYARGVAFSPDGQRLAVSYGNAGIVRICELEGGREWCRVQAPNGNDTGRLDFAPDGRRLLVTCIQGSALVWDVGDPQAPAVTTLKGNERPIRFAAFLPDGRTVLTGDDEAIRWWSLGSPAPVPEAAAAAPPATDRRWVWAVAGIVALALVLSVAAYFFLRRRRAKGPAGASPAGEKAQPPAATAVKE